MTRWCALLLCACGGAIDVPSGAPAEVSEPIDSGASLDAATATGSYETSAPANPCAGLGNTGACFDAATNCCMLTIPETEAQKLYCGAGLVLINGGACVTGEVCTLTRGAEVYHGVCP